MNKDITYLYIKEHIPTGKKYFGKTIRDPYVYKGSGSMWTNILKKHGGEVKTTVLKTFKTGDMSIKSYALEFSKIFDIVSSKLWANLIPEDGIDGVTPGTVFSEEHKKHLSIAAKKRPPISASTKKKLSIANIGENNSMYGRTGSLSHMYNKPRKASTKKKIKDSWVSRPIITCPHCGLEGRGGSMKQWHFDNCKKKIKNKKL